MKDRTYAVGKVIYPNFDLLYKAHRDPDFPYDILTPIEERMMDHFESIMENNSAAYYHFDEFKHANEELTDIYTSLKKPARDITLHVPYDSTIMLLYSHFNAAKMVIHDDRSEHYDFDREQLLRFLTPGYQITDVKENIVTWSDPYLEEKLDIPCLSSSTYTFHMEKY